MITDVPLGIDGLEWQDTYRVDNGGGSSVIPFPTTHLAHLVFHGNQPFSHGQYGLHVGLEDRLTFLGDATQLATGYFIDCRADSPTLHARITFEFYPSSRRTLRIPCGVAHCFDGLEGVYTLNSFEAFLPPPNILLTDASPWATGADILNFPMDASDDVLPVVKPNPFKTSDRFHELLSVMQSETLGSIDYEYPTTEQVSFADGTSNTLMVRKRLTETQVVSDWEPVSGLDGVGWKKHLIVWSGAEAGYTALTDPAPMQVIDHGTNYYSTDAYGIHLEWEDRLTFVGPSGQAFVIKFIDCREDSPTFHVERSIEVRPSALRYLVVPCGVAHAFEGLQNIFTINRPMRTGGDPDAFDPGNDVIDWPLDRRPAPGFQIRHNSFPYEYYRELAAMQRAYLESPDNLSTASVLLVDDGTGAQVRVAIRAAT